jgi:hypothetical protein
MDVLDMNKRKWYSFIEAGAFIAVALLAACVSIEPPTRMYDGPMLPKEQIAIIRIPSTAYPYTTYPCIDGRGAHGNEIHVLPGKHQLRGGFKYQPSLLVSSLLGAVSGTSYYKFYSSILEFEVQAGHEYVVNGDVIKDLPLMWVEDITTKQIVTRNTAVYQDYGFNPYKFSEIECGDKP